MNKNKKHFKTAAFLIAAILAVTVFIGANSAAKDEPIVEEVKKDVLVETQVPDIGDIVVTNEFIGKIEPNQQVAVIPKVAGEVLAVNYSVGDRVQAGDVLCEIDSRTLQSAIAQTEAAVASAQAKANLNLSMARNDLATMRFNQEKGFDSTKNAAQAALERAENGLATATAGLSATRRKLHELRDDEDNFMSMTGATFEQTESQYKDAVVQAELGVEAAQLAVDQAKENLKTSGIMTKEQEVQAKTRVKAAELNINFNDQHIALQKMKDDLQYYKVTAPISGIIEQRNVDQFGIASNAGPVYVISDKESMIVSFKVSELSYNHIKVGQKIILDKNGDEYMGEVTEISTMVDPASGLFTIKAAVKNPPQDLYTGAIIKIIAETDKAESAMMLPLSMIYYDDNVAYVYIAKDGIAKKQIIETGIANLDTIEVVSGLNKDDAVITSWHPELSDGAKISMPSDSSSAPAETEASQIDESSSSAASESSLTTESSSTSAEATSSQIDGNSKTN